MLMPAFVPHINLTMAISRHQTPASEPPHVLSRALIIGLMMQRGSEGDAGCLEMMAQAIPNFFPVVFALCLSFANSLILVLFVMICAFFLLDVFMITFMVQFQEMVSICQSKPVQIYNQEKHQCLMLNVFFKRTLTSNVRRESIYYL